MSASRAYDDEVIVADNVDVNQTLDTEVIKEAAKADEEERNLQLSTVWRTHRKAVMWSMLLSAALIMEGYDLIVITAFYGQPNFQRRFGQPDPLSQSGYSIPAKWQTALSNGSAAGGIIGLIINGWAADRYGPKIVMMTCLVLLAGLIFISVFANSLEMLVIAEVFCGIPWGVFQTLTTAYASEVCPIQLRGYLTAWVNLSWGIGILLSSGVVKATLPMTSDWGWRLPFVVQWVWIPPLLAVVYFCPMSPWWLVRKGRLDDAEASVRRLADPAMLGADNARNTVALMVHTNELERQAQEGTTYVQCFTGTDRRRTEIVMMTFAMQLLSGENLVGQGVQFLENAGISTALAFDLSMVINSMFIIGTIASWGLLTLFGRRTIYTGGMATMAITLLVIGGLGCIKATASNYQSATYAIGSLMIFLSFVYNCTLGPCCYTIIGETSSTRLRAKSIVLSRIAYQLMNIICGIIVPRMLSTSSWNWGAKSGFFWAGSAALSTVYCLLRLPETKGRSYGELDLLFEHKVPAWRFKSTKVDQFANVHGNAETWPQVEKESDKLPAHHIETSGAAAPATLAA